MRAAVLREAGAELRIEDVKLSEPESNEVVVRVEAAGVCHTDLHAKDGRYPVSLPTVLGHEAAGVVEAAGRHVSHVSVGDHVVACSSVFCGVCEHCLGGRPNRCVNHEATRRGAGAEPRIEVGDEQVHQFFNLSSFAERMLVHEHAVVKIPSAMPLDRAALLGCSVTTGLGAVFRTAKVRPGDTVAVIGCGGVGLSAVQAARIAGANQIIGIDRADAKLVLARELGATHTVNASAVDPVLEVEKLTSGLGVHHAFEAVGQPATTEQAVAMLRRGGTATLVGLFPSGAYIQLPGAPFLVDEKRLQGSKMGSNRFRVDIPRYVDMYLDGRLRLDEMISERIHLDEVNKAFDRMRTGAHARSVIMMR
ncbi:MAG: Zn-dependent alcohol dehydrogenase [Actinobacteria bacterium]|nr:Zn-dependent alcohol dehydrogenase [Actinomycetota bacterium]